MKLKKTGQTRLLGVMGLAAIAALSIWQFYVFATFRTAFGAFDVQGGLIHLWLAIGLALIGCVAAFFFFSVFLRFDRSEELHITHPPSGKTLTP